MVVLSKSDAADGLGLGMLLQLVLRENHSLLGRYEVMGFDLIHHDKGDENPQRLLRPRFMISKSERNASARRGQLAVNLRSFLDIFAARSPSIGCRRLVHGD